jgi:hypothetical protein
MKVNSPLYKVRHFCYTVASIFLRGATMISTHSMVTGTSEIRSRWNTVKKELMAYTAAALATATVLATGVIALITGHDLEATLATCATLCGAAVTRIAFQRIRARFETPGP